MGSSKWSKYNQVIDDLIEDGRTDWNNMSFEILGQRDLTDSLRTYIKRRSKKIVNVSNKTKSYTKDYKEPSKFVLSAWNDSDGSMMDIDTYCEYYNLPRTDISSYKLISHTGTPYYNIVFKEKAGSDEVDYDIVRDEMIKEMNELSPVVEKYKRKEIKDPHCLVLDIADLHIGKLATQSATGTYYDVDLAIKRAISGSESLIDKSKPYNINKVFFIIGNDILHIDTPKRTTTSGTPQDTDGMWYDNFKIARIVYTQIIQRLTIIADVHVIHCPSNHDYMTGFMLADAVSCFFRNNGNVTFDVSNKHRKYVTYGDNLLAFSHGDGAKLDKIPYLTAHEAADMWSRTKYRYGYLHHLHHKQYYKFMSGVDYIGMTIEYLRSPSESDRWHSDNGFTGSKVAIEAFIHHPEHGQISRLTHNF